jgi:AcrR family transcriptional regulator
VAGEILLEDGPHALTMERLAERAGVSKGLGYAYFRDADEVALTLWDREVGFVYRRIEEATAGAGSFEEGFRRAVRTYFDLVAERGDLLGILRAHFGDRAERRIRRRVRSFLGFWSRQIAQAFALEPGSAATLGAMWVSAVDAGARAWGLGLVDREEAERLCGDVLLDGVAHLPPRRSGR